MNPGYLRLQRQITLGKPRERTILLFLGVLVVSAAFGLLVSAAETSKVTVDQNLAAYWRTSYDILLRPRGYRSAIEKEYGLVQANHLSGIPGGITFEQYEAIKSIPGVAVAAPIAMLSYFDLEIRFAPWLKLERKELIDEPGVYSERITLTETDNVRKYGTVWQEYYYVGARGAEHSVEELQSLYAQGLNVWTLDGDHPSALGSTYRFPVLMAAIDPEQESELVGLDSTIVQGTCFASGDRSEKIRGTFAGMDESIYSYIFPILLNAHSYAQAEIRRDLWRIELPAEGETLEDILKRGGVDYLATLPSHLQSSFTISNEEVFRWLPLSWDRFSLQSWGGDEWLGFVRFTNPPSGIQYVEKEVPWAPSRLVLEAVPLGKANCQGPNSTCTSQVRFRTITRQEIGDSPAAIGGKLEGVFEIEKLSPLSNESVYVPVETYYPPLATLRHDENGNLVDPPVVIHPTFHPESYIQRPPLILTTLEAAKLFNPVDPISAIRVRVGDIDRFSPEAQAKIEAVASAIVEATGLEMDMVVGSSPRRVLVHIPAYEEIPPLGYVEEQWIQKGVTLSYGREIKRVNLIFFGLILSVCTLNILNTTLMTALGHRREIALRKALGWRSSTVFRLTLLEVGRVGLIAGGVGVPLAWGLAGWLHLHMPLERALLILPLGVGLCLLGGLVPAWLAARTPPAVLLQRGEVSPDRHSLPGRLSLLTYGLRSLLRRRTRAVLMILTMTLATALLTVLLVGSLGLRGYLSATLLGEYLVLRIEGHHYLMAGVCLLVAGLTTADALLVSALERRREIGILKAVGWRTEAVARLFVVEGMLLGLAGGVMGWLAGLAVYGLLYWGLPTQAWWVTLPALGMPVLVGALAAWYPARQAARMPPAEAVRYE
ncbi:MAG: ABC transporter permease [Chloroflexota bacterium]|nr:ABC transporter permease [Chloroflexota bacterium]